MNISKKEVLGTVLKILFAYDNFPSGIEKKKYISITEITITFFTWNTSTKDQNCMQFHDMNVWNEGHVGHAVHEIN